MSERPTVKAVVRFAEQLRREAERHMVADPHCNPYSVTTAAARNLCSAMSGHLERQLLKTNPDATEEEIAEARLDGPRLALADLEWRAGRWEREYRQAQADDKERHKVFKARQTHALERKRKQLAHLTFGQRLDRALAGLAAVSATPAARAFDAKVTGTKEQPLPRFPGDPSGNARRIARKAVEQVEDELETARRRRVENDAA